MELFAGRVAHDILSPLGTVKFALDLAARPDVDDAQRRDVTTRGSAALDRVKRLVSGLLRFARAGAKPEPGATADVEPTIADVVADLANEAEEAGVELTVEHTGSNRVACNPGVLTSLVANLARNAIKYIGEGPTRRVAIRSSEKGGFVRVEVTDTGPGLPPGVEDLVFEPYVRAAGTTKPGIGLGLATVKRMTEAHGGNVGVRSVPGQGSTFWFELPKAPEAGEDKGSGVVRRASVAS